MEGTVFSWRIIMPLNSIKGEYIPSFFSIILKTDEDISVAIEKNESTFIHEFIHYLQDLILPYTIRVNLSNIRWFLNIQQFAINNGYIKRPFKEWDYDANLTKLQYSYTMGTDYFVDDVKDIGNPIVISKEQEGFDASFSNKQRKFNVYKYSIPINNGSETYNLGARDLLEYIAHKIEVRHYPSYDKVSQLPYQSVDLLFEKYGLSYLPEDIRLCIAECCLYNDNPMHFLFSQFLKNSENKQILARLRLNYADTYEFLLSIMFETTDNIVETLSHKRKRRLEQFRDNLGLSYFHFPKIVSWISKVSFFSTERLSERFIFSDIYKMSNTEFLNFIQEVISTIGVPLVMNKKGQYISLPNMSKDADQFIQFYILQEFLMFIDCKSKSCPIQKLCQANYDLVCRRTQIFDRQKRINQCEKCPLLEFLSPYGLSNIQYR